MIGDSKSSLRSGNFVRVGEERTSPTSYARTFKCTGLMIGFESRSSDNNALGISR